MEMKINVGRCGIFTATDIFIRNFYALSGNFSAVSAPVIRGGPLHQPHICQYLMQFFFLLRLQFCDGSQTFSYRDPLLNKPFLDRCQLKLSVQCSLVVACHVFLVDIYSSSGRYVGAGSNGTGSTVAERSVDQSVSSAQDMETVVVSCQADIFGCVGHVAGAVFDGDDVVNLGQTCNGGWCDGDVGLWRIVVQDDRQRGAVGDFRLAHCCTG